MLKNILQEIIYGVNGYNLSENIICGVEYDVEVEWILPKESDYRQSIRGEES